MTEEIYFENVFKLPERVTVNWVDDVNFGLLKQGEEEENKRVLGCSVREKSRA